MPTSRNDAVSAYFPNFRGTSGIKIYKNNLKCQTITGTITSANIVYSKTHQLGKTPTVVIVTPWYAVNEAKNFTSGAVVSESRASAATSAGFYVIGNRAGVRYKAVLML